MAFLVLLIFLKKSLEKLVAVAKKKYYSKIWTILTNQIEFWKCRKAKLMEDWSLETNNKKAKYKN